ncbi:hypothetical protein [Phytohabitans kaempferiae]|uniref:Lysoplasmalogenase n=1 Tax=Phytohabitans kaempferiae TaxID=1620943 RepID=A0ABV6M1U7_9ACTN
MSAATVEAGRGTPYRVLRAIGRRWPAGLALVMSVPMAGGADVAGQVSGLGEVLLLLPMLYLVTARTGRRGLSWPLLAAAFGLIFAVRGLDLVPAPFLLVPLGAALLVWSVVGGHAHRGGVRIQALGLVGFSALALLGLALDPDVGLYVVAAGWLLHGVWDFVHLRLDRVVARSYAEWCGVVDILVAAQLLALAW